MKKIVFTFTVCAFSFMSYAQQHISHDGASTSTVQATTNAATVSPAIPALEEALSFKETEYNFGKIPQGKPVTHIFAVSNSGKTPFKLDNVQASCGCTTPQWDKEKTITPGASSEITVGYNAASEGPFTKNITVTYNGTQTKVILIKGEVWKTPSDGAPANKGLNELN